MADAAMDSGIAKCRLARVLAVVFVLLTAAMGLAWSHSKLMSQDEMYAFQTYSVPTVGKLVQVQRTWPISLDPLLYLPHLQLKALRLQQILDDTVTPPSARDKIAAAAPHTEQVDRYKDTAAHVKAWRANGLNGWLRQQLQPAPLETASKLP